MKMLYISEISAVSSDLWSAEGDSVRSDIPLDLGPAREHPPSAHVVQAAGGGASFPLE
jgi:hypothetical protein